MPLPTPKKNESKNDFISRCMGDETMRKEYSDESQRRAVCESQWDRGKEKSQASLSQVIEYMSSTAWAIVPETLDAIHTIIDSRLRYGKPSEEEIAIRLSGDRQDGQPYTTTDGIRVIPIRGVISKRMNLLSRMSGGTSIDVLKQEISSAINDDDVSGVLLDIESPGGTVDGPFELSDFLFKQRGKKPVQAYANGQMASAAYLIGSASDKIIASPISQIGSIGVIATHFDYSKRDEKEGIKRTYITSGKYKAIAHDRAPLSKAGQQYIQEKADYFYSMFVDAVARNRGVSTDKVLSDMADGKIFIGEQAVDCGLVDHTGTMDDALAGLKEEGQEVSLHQPDAQFVNADILLWAGLYPVAKDDKNKKGGSNKGKYTDKDGPFCGPAGGAPAKTYPVNTRKRAKAALAYARHAPNPAGIVKCVCRHWPDLPKCQEKKKKGVKSSMNKDEFKEEHPELYQQIVDEATTAFAKEKQEMADKIADLTQKLQGAESQKDELETKLSEAEKRLDALEKAEEKRVAIAQEAERKRGADEIWTEKLTKSDIPKHLHNKVRKMVNYGSFIKDDGQLDVEAFAQAVDAEIKDPSWKVADSPVLGEAHLVRGEEDEGTAEDDKLADDIFQASSGQPTGQE